MHSDLKSYLIVGLGNIGAEYEKTRHNIGFDVLDAFSLKKDTSFTSERLAFYSLVRVKGKKIHCIKPTTYMNLSGKAVKYWTEKLNIAQENILVIADDLALPLAKLRMRQKGSDAGHNGIKNITEILGYQEYTRLRFGIGNQFAKGQQVDFVLGKWQEVELESVTKAINLAVLAIESFVLEGCERTMMRVNAKG